MSVTSVDLSAVRSQYHTQLPADIQRMSISKEQTFSDILESLGFIPIDSFETSAQSSDKSTKSTSFLRAIAPCGVTVFVDFRKKTQYDNIASKVTSSKLKSVSLVPSTNTKEGFTDFYKFSAEKCLGYSVCGLAYVCLDKFCYIPTLHDRAEEIYTFESSAIRLENTVLTYPIIDFDMIVNDPKAASGAVLEAMLHLRKMELQNTLNDLVDFDRSIGELFKASATISSDFKERLLEINSTMELLQRFYMTMNAKPSLSPNDSKTLQHAVTEISHRDKMLLELQAQMRLLIEQRRNIEKSIMEFKATEALLNSKLSGFRFSKT